MVQVIYREIEDGIAGVQLSIAGCSRENPLFTKTEKLLVRSLSKQLARMSESILPVFSVNEVAEGVEDAVVISAIPSPEGVARVIACFQQALFGFEELQEAHPESINIIVKETKENEDE